MNQTLLTAVRQGDLVVTGSRRLSRHIRLRYAEQQQTNGLAVWESGRILSFEGWLQQLSEEVFWSSYKPARGPRSLLNTTQEQALWEAVIRGSPEFNGLLDLRATARLAREAWALVQRWRLPDPTKARLASDDARAFSRWMRDYYTECREHGWLDVARLPDALVAAISSGALTLPQRVQLVGFDELNPQQRSLFRALQTMGSELRMTPVPSTRGEMRRVRFENPEDELDGIARWARNLISNDQSARVGVVVPRLNALRATLERVFDDVLVPGAELPGSSPTGRPYEFASGPPLDEYPLVQAALIIMRCALGQVSIHDMTRLLRSPFVVGGASEGPKRALFDAFLRAHGVLNLDLGHISRLFSEFRLVEPDRLLLEACFQGVKPKLRTAEFHHLPSEWSAHLRLFLEAFGWPGERVLTSTEAQTVEAFRDTLTEFGTLDAVRGTCRADVAVSELERQLGARHFSPKGPDVPIQLMGLEEARGFQFDGLWISGARDDVLPASPQPNPFIPAEWRQRYELPGSSARIQLERARRLARALSSSSPEVIVSHSTESEEGEIGVSPLFAGATPMGSGDLALADVTDYRRALQSSTRLEVLSDARGPALDQVEAVQGGTRIFTLQAACPFRAFAELRLGARPLAVPSVGLDPVWRGFLIHAALESIWHRIGSSDVLHAGLEGDYLEVQLWEVVDRVLELLDKKRLVALGQRYRGLEHARLVRLLTAWLQIERERLPFEVVGTEIESKVTIGGIEISTRVDRIDRIVDEGLAIIDYKMSPHGPAEWLGPRPAEPQLPVYALSENDELVAVLFARVRAGDMRFTGAARSEAMVPGIPGFDDTPLAARHGLTWAGLSTYWRERLTALAEHYAQGDARVDPKNGADTCRQCGMAALCRVREQVEPAEQASV